MAARLILLAVIAVSAANAVVFMDTSGPEDMHFPVKRALENIVNKYIDNLSTLLQMKVKSNQKHAQNEKAREMVNRVINERLDTLLKVIDYAGSRGYTPDLDDPQQAVDLNTECDDTYGCSKLNLKMNRDIYKTLSEGYSAAGSHEDADVQTALVPLIQKALGSVRFNKARVAKAEAKAAMKHVMITKKEPEIFGGDDILFDDSTLI